MIKELLFIIIIAALLGYIIFLNIQLAKKNIFIESTVKRLSGIEKNWSADEMKRFLYEIRKVHDYHSLLTDKLFEERSMNFLLENEKDSRIYIHYTKEENDALNILKDGFRFEETFYKTALPVSGDRLDLLIKHNGRKSFGDYVIILCLSDKIISHYAAEMDRNRLRSFSVENVLTENAPFRDDNSELVYVLSPRFVKGIINHRTGEITRNPVFNPLYDSPNFEKNIEMLKAGEIT
ncbi:MAG: hypothetical protein MUO72_02990 [Bacteroidales bacterium]|nr:hypothetical protein [Bacteroidales bacterium]